MIFQYLYQVVDFTLLWLKENNKTKDKKDKRNL